jgi:hypothetical protein
MRKRISILFAALMLLSSGITQLALHDCPSNGVYLFSDCGMHNSENQKVKLPDCCKKSESSPQETQDCGNCEENFIFALTPKFGNIGLVETHPPAVIILMYTNTTIPDLRCTSPILAKQNTWIPPAGEPDIRTKDCSWLI